MAVDEVVTDSYTCPYLVGGGRGQIKVDQLPRIFCAQKKALHQTFPAGRNNWNDMHGEDERIPEQER